MTAPRWLAALVAVLALAAASATQPPAGRPTQPPSPGLDGEAAWRELLDDVDRWSTPYPGLVQRVDLGESAGGRPLFVLRIGCQDDGPPEVYVSAAIHGNERSEDDALWLVEELLARREQPEIATLLASRVLWMQPAVNPDGLVARQRRSAHGVDLNRNFGARWQPGPRGGRDDPGPAAFSEPETRAVRDFLAGRSQLRACLDLHRSTSLLVPAQSGDEGLVDDRVRAAAEALDAALGGPSFASGHFASLHGLLIDWEWNALGVRAFALESRGDPSAPFDHDPRWRALLHLLQNAPRYPQRPFGEPATSPPCLVTDHTRSHPKELARLTRPGTVLFEDGFESEASLRSYFEITGQAAGRVRITHDPEHVHGGDGALQLTTEDRDGASCGAGPALWLGDDGYDVLHLRYWIRYAGDYDQGNLHHTGGSIVGVAGNDRWAGMGKAGLRPSGDDWCSARVEGWRDWRRLAPPGYLYCYTYWMDMRRDRDGHYWGNMLAPVPAERIVPAREQWMCVEQRIALNTPGKDDGELAVWLDGELYLHERGLRWRSTAALRCKRIALLLYVHESRQRNRVWFDDLTVSTGYIGTK